MKSVKPGSGEYMEDGWNPTLSLDKKRGYFDNCKEINIVPFAKN